MLVTHVLPRLLAHVLAITSFYKLYHYFITRLSFTTFKKLRSSVIYTTLLGHTFVHCLKFLTAAYGWVVFIPNVVGKSINATKHYGLTV